MLEITPKPGMAAISKQGRDKGREYVIISVADKDFVFVSDGTARPLKKQKKKRVKHLKLTAVVFEGIEAKLNKTDKKKLYDTEIKRAIKLWKIEDKD
jgi:ribosomal protein L14E/L6E/L27E